ncbi:unnamed protein product [Arabidopsis lyrata]|uniref:Predicted protein n=1 Tax=Arabidopsis lyrata subsp. lyrata TaxID=81972 RepID=D7L9H8_ARALL|nr:putative defensin-like protein 256 [Arabidopsis lyrata subsp. lyrata]EFH60339.1 predicted protein [Arabidopsis lyrata subsp. lyrata]CAH8262578.1 unnamed protein product [Arabidopsis lyrata]|eukprot:XP_002884080.1 putative defensin-like protein 256 [Arabidopsis lyrata subsp. lyrata]
MKSIFFKLLLLVSLLVITFRQNYAVADYCDRDDDCKPVCMRPYACNLTRHVCMCRPNDVSSSKQRCIPEHKGCGRGPPPH